MVSKTGLQTGISIMISGACSTFGFAILGFSTFGFAILGFLWIEVRTEV
jgi:hypothetical protein